MPEYALYAIVDGIIGSSTDKGHEGQIDLMTWDFRKSGSGPDAIRDYRGVTIVVPGDDKSIPGLMRAMAQGRQIANVKIESYKDGQMRYRYHYENVSIESAQVASDAGSFDLYADSYTVVHRGLKESDDD